MPKRASEDGGSQQASAPVQLGATVRASGCSPSVEIQTARAEVLAEVPYLHLKETRPGSVFGIAARATAPVDGCGSSMIPKTFCLDLLVGGQHATYTGSGVCGTTFRSAVRTAHGRWPQNFHELLNRGQRSRECLAAGLADWEPD